LIAVARITVWPSWFSVKGLRVVFLGEGDYLGLVDSDNATVIGRPGPIIVEIPQVMSVHGRSIADQVVRRSKITEESRKYFDLPAGR
jgi:hypothetical protein